MLEQVEAPRGERGEEQPSQAQKHLDRPRLLEHDEDAVEDDRDEQDVDAVGDAERAERRPHRQRERPCAPRRTASATRTA